MNCLIHFNLLLGAVGPAALNKAAVAINIEYECPMIL